LCAKIRDIGVRLTCAQWKYKRIYCALCKHVRFICVSRSCTPTCVYIWRGGPCGMRLSGSWGCNLISLMTSRHHCSAMS